MSIILKNDAQKKIDRDQLFNAVEKYIKKHYKPSSIKDIENLIDPTKKRHFKKEDSGKSKTLIDKIAGLFLKREKTFSEQLMKLIEEKGMQPVDVYTKANINKQNFSKIKNDIYYQPSKGTALALAISLHLNLDETLDLIRRAGFTLSHTIKSDVIVEYFIKEKFYDVDEINIQLHDRGLAQLNNNRKMKDKNKNEE